jgi:hypothetical protein
LMNTRTMLLSLPNEASTHFDWLTHELSSSYSTC